MPRSDHKGKAIKLVKRSKKGYEHKCDFDFAKYSNLHKDNGIRCYCGYWDNSKLYPMHFDDPCSRENKLDVIEKDRSI